MDKYSYLYVKEGAHGPHNDGGRGAGRTIRTNHKRDMKWYDYVENYSASQVTWKVMETDGTRLLYMGLERGTS
jgi:hypothetical protein